MDAGTEPTRIGVTGHLNLTADTAELVAAALRELLAAYCPEELVGVSCLAPGADTVFAEAVVAHGGRLEVVLPAADYRATKVTAEHAAAFDRMAWHAASVRVMAHARAGRAAYEDANAAMLADCDLLVAVWDGRPAADQGGTAAVVARARTLGMPVVVVWPEGSRRA
ncbi:hypothetical protein [Catellatospora chokoriensis]|uniref:Uncharacterized protein n=1 Tax=Catellatospora chokoriensis TaxID=310353 RepID=A0A8J3NW58_9ACTN|nr:hypothetical protein [Catellatospora chokoriensis]GIF94586.1 hypothetical protein Cch02nite_80300 [Catellatospora chokoriensis]